MRSINRRHSTEEFNVWPSFTDVVTGIFLFLIFVFIILIIQQFLYSVRLSELEKFLGTLEEEMGALQKEFSKESGIGVDVKQGRIILPEQILFDFGSSVIKPSSEKKLKRVGELLKKALDRQKDLLYVSIDGHTDSFGSYEYNLDLGSKRATAVLNFLTYNAEINPMVYDISANTFGEYKPADGEPYQDNRVLEKNRRIEIRIIPKFDRLLQRLKQ
jgi:chemotaxis protein MotB